jgi:signal transduction histidine kinase
MMNKPVTFSLILMVLLLVPLTLFAGSREEAKALAIKAADYIDSNGIDNAVDVMHATDGGFQEGELYVFVLAMDGVILIHGTNPKLEGKNLIGVKDPNGVYFTKNMIEAGKTKGEGWIDYMWKNPKTKKLANKEAFVKKVNSIDAVVGVGYYK